MLLDHLRHICIILVIVLWIWNRNKAPSWYLPLGLCLLLIFCTEASALILLKVEASNHEVYNLYTIANTILSMLLISRIASLDLKWVYGVSTVILSLICYHFIFGPGIQFLDGGSAIISGFFLAGFAAIGLYRISEEAESKLLSLPSFWLLSAYLLYYLCFSPIIGLVNFVAQDSMDLARSLLKVNDILFILHFILIGYSILLLNKQSNNPANG